MTAVSFRIRQFEKADFDTLWRIDQACFDPQLAYSRPELAFYMRRPGSFTLVAEGDGGGNNGAAPYLEPLEYSHYIYIGGIKIYSSYLYWND